MPSPWEQEEEKLRRLARKQELRILVWGPGDPGTGGDAASQQRYKKRVQMRDAVQAAFTESEVRFSEDPVLVNSTAYIPGQLRKEAVHASAAHVVLMLDVSRGVDLELDHFVPTYTWFRDKAYVFLPEAYVGTSGLVSDVLQYLREDQVRGFSQDDLDSCRLATQVSVEIVDAVAMDYLLRQQGLP